MSKPIIGVTPLWDEEKDSLWMFPGYMDGVSNAGGVPVVLPLTSDTAILGQICGMVDGLLFTGGQDVFPGIYGEETRASCGITCVEKDEMESFLFWKAVLVMDKPAFGICRGIQLFNAMLGGTLYQDLPSEFKGTRPHEHQHEFRGTRPHEHQHELGGTRLISHQQDKPYDMPSHIVSVTHGSPLHELLGTDSIKVNSMHHQAISKLSSELDCMATAEDGLVEAVRMPDKHFVWAVQWHPEHCLSVEHNLMLFEVFVKACAE
jgi:putative glutamine amidotransferase